MMHSRRCCSRRRRASTSRAGGPTDRRCMRAGQEGRRARSVVERVQGLAAEGYGYSWSTIRRAASLPVRCARRIARRDAVRRLLGQEARHCQSVCRRNSRGRSSPRAARLMRTAALCLIDGNSENFKKSAVPSLKRGYKRLQFSYCLILVSPNHDRP